MLKNLLARLFKSKEPEHADSLKIVYVKKSLNIKKAFATIRTKTGEDIICREFYGWLEYPSSGYYLICTGKSALINFFHKHSNDSGLILVKNDRMIRGIDIMDIVGIVESDHIVELEVPEVQTVKILK
jgi:hypothetical protein